MDNITFHAIQVPLPTEVNHVRHFDASFDENGKAQQFFIYRGTPYCVIIFRKENGTYEGFQCKYVCSASMRKWRFCEIHQKDNGFDAYLTF